MKNDPPLSEVAARVHARAMAASQEDYYREALPVYKYQRLN